jgi:ribonuclease inhibitor
MRVVKLDGEQMTNREKVHELLQEQLKIEGYHGRNLDALFDALVSHSQDMDIMLFHKSELIVNQGQYGEAIIATFKDAAAGNEHICFKIIII